MSVEPIKTSSLKEPAHGLVPDPGADSMTLFDSANLHLAGAKSLVGMFSVMHFEDQPNEATQRGAWFAIGMLLQHADDLYNEAHRRKR